jgi:phosphoribosylaminoimidazole-succinocarboxamide synthase
VTDYGLPEGYTHVYSGKVRDLYRTPEDRLLFIASDRISAYDWVLPTTIPDKGRILTKLSLWWFQMLEVSCPITLRPLLFRRLLPVAQ